MNHPHPLPAGLVGLIQNLKAGERQTVVAYGTSLTAGGRWVKDLEEWLELRHPGQARVINSGLSGKASNTALAHLEEQVLAHRPDMVFLEFAINDASSYDPGDVDHGISPEQSAVNLTRLIYRIRASQSSVEIILQTMNSCWDAPNGNRSASRRPRLPDYYAVYRRIAAEQGLLLMDHHANWVRLQREDVSAFEHYIPDGVHPTGEGSTAITFPLVMSLLLQGFG